MIDGLFTLAACPRALDRTMLRRLAFQFGCLLSFAAALEAQTTQKSESFDTEPCWGGKNNLIETKPVQVIQEN